MSPEDRQDFYDAFGVLVREGRRCRGLDQIDLAEAVGISQSTMSKIENGDVRPALHIAVALAGFLGLSLDELVVEVS